MKLHYYNILLFFFPLNILLTSYQEHNKNKPYITTHHTATTKSRVLSKYDIQSSIYHNDRYIKSVKENFDRETSQRLREYEERMKVKRQKRKEKRDKNIRKIIEKDKMEKSFAEKVEERCLRCGWGLGGVAASVGLFGGFGIYGWKTAALAAVKEAVKDAAMVAGEAARIPADIDAVISGIKTEFDILTLNGQELETFLNVIGYTNEKLISEYILMQYESTCLCSEPVTVTANVGPEPICISVWNKSLAGLGGQGGFVKETKVIEATVRTVISDAETVAAVKSTYAICQTAIIASVVAILIIALVMIIIYLVLRYRRKKKMNKKSQYTKLLNQ
ncbi:rifin PIR protein,putative [Plasmodium sp. DRC-Itaito]|nr:rifin PIR protein,putative [Plasmodium sp. DRC-Itaito]